MTSGQVQSDVRNVELALEKHEARSTPLGGAEGQELVVEEPELGHAQAGIDQWAQELEAAANQLPIEEHDRFRQALDQIERESKSDVRRQWGLP